MRSNATMDAREIDIMHELERTNTALNIAIEERDAAREIAEGLRLVLLEQSNGLVLANLRAGLMEDERDAAIAERNAVRSEVATYRKTLDEVSEIGTNAIAVRAVQAYPHVGAQA